MRDPYWGRRALDFVDASESAMTSEAVLSLFEKEISQLGFSAYIMAGIPSAGDVLNDLTLVNGWPRGWLEHYTSSGYLHNDPIPRHCATTVHAFDWNDAKFDRERDTAALTVMQRACDFGLNQGFCIPVHYDAGGAVVSIAGERPELNSNSKGAIHLIGLYAHNRIRQLTKPIQKKERLLTDREREVIQWVAIGKTSDETAEIMSLTERTVRFYLNSASQKLRTVNRTATVVQALKTGEIIL